MSAQGLVGSKGAGFFTVAVIVDKIGVLTSKSGKKFTILVLSDLVKYDLNRVKKHLTQEYGKDQEGLKQALRSFNRDGYKTISVMVFGEAAALDAKNINSGTVIAALNPRLMSPNSSSGSDK